MEVKGRPLRQEPFQAVNTIFVYSEEMGLFDFGESHPFKPERAVKTYDLCNLYGVMFHPWMTLLRPEPVPTILLRLFHTPDYLKFLAQASRMEEGQAHRAKPEHGLGTCDNPILPGIYEWSLRAVGGTHMAMEHLIRGDALAAFNPYGGFHHAMPDHAEGFCYLNDIVITLMDALRKLARAKIAYIDCDAHHGNGVQEAFYENPRVLFISFHESGRILYPGSGSETEIGAGDGTGFTVNVPLEPGTDDEVFAFVFDEVVPPLVGAFSPDFVVTVLGADALISDPLTHLMLTNNSYHKAVRKIMDLCPKVLALGGGGYDLYATARCWTLAWSILNQLDPMPDVFPVSGRRTIAGPEMELGGLYDPPYHTRGQLKKMSLARARRVVQYIQKEIFPIHGL
jgi:acetoin utilization protein AcuC